MAEATFWQGNVSAMDYTPGADVVEGQVVVLGEIPYVAHRPIATGVQGAVAERGGAYKIIGDGTLDTPGALAYWDDTAKKITATAISNTHFGYTSPDQGLSADDDVMVISHEPHGINT